MSDIYEFFLSARSTVVRLECVEISHPNFSQTYRVVRNHVSGVTVTLETAATATFTYYPLRITRQGMADDLDFAIQVDWGDLGGIAPAEIARVKANDGFGTKPTVVYRTYRSDDLTTLLEGPITLEVSSVANDGEKCAFVAKAPTLNLNRTGEVYDKLRFPGLVGFL